MSCPRRRPAAGRCSAPSLLSPSPDCCTFGRPNRPHASSPRLLLAMADHLQRVQDVGWFLSRPPRPRRHPSTHGRPCSSLWMPRGRAQTPPQGRMLALLVLLPRAPAADQHHRLLAAAAPRPLVMFCVGPSRSARSTTWTPRPYQDRQASSPGFFPQVPRRPSFAKYPFGSPSSTTIVVNRFRNVYYYAQVPLQDVPLPSPKPRVTQASSSTTLVVYNYHRPRVILIRQVPI